MRPLVRACGSERFPARLVAPLAIAAGAVVLRLIAGVGFANYDTLYALAWGGQLARGETPQYGIPIAPTPHPLVEALGVVLSPLSPRAIEDVTVALGFLALSACGWVVYRLGSLWFGRAAGALAALILLTRVPVLSYGVRAYVDIPYLLLVLCALLVEARRHRSGIDGIPIGRRARRCSRCSRSRGCCAPRRGCSRGSTGCTWCDLAPRGRHPLSASALAARASAHGSRPPGPAASWRAWRCSRRRRRWCGWRATGWLPGIRCGRSRTRGTPPKRSIA